MTPAQQATEPMRMMRADARRNHDRLLVAAEAAFAAQGTDASLEDIAKEAGVGIGTLYRHFPTRQDLLEALLRDRFDSCRARADELDGSLSPADALHDWMRSLAAQSRTYRGLSSSVLTALCDEQSQLFSSCQAMRTAGARLLANAQRAGAVRADVDITDLFVLANAVAWAGDQAEVDPARADHLLLLVLGGLRP